MTDVIAEPAGTSARRPRVRRRRWGWIAGAVVTLAVAFVLVWFQPQKLFIDERVDDAVPTAAPVPPALVTGEDLSDDTPAPDTSTSQVAPAAPAEVATGAFVSLDHATSGAVRVLDLGDGQRVLRLEDLDTDNGPDLFLYLTTNPADGPEGAFDEDFVNLGRLRGNQGDQNYDVAAEVDFSRFSTVVIWCDRFDSAFGAAALTTT